jgi:uncharacterized protein (DUF2062 family)
MTRAESTSQKRPWYKRHYHKLMGLQDSPHAIALGFSCGIFLGFTPLFGLKTILSICLAWLFRSNKIASVIGVTLHDFSLPFVPMLLRLEYVMGYWLLSYPHQMPPHMHFKEVQLELLFQWTTFLTIGGPLMLGSVIIGLPFAVLSYYASKWVVVEYRLKRAAYLKKHLSPTEGDDTFS